MGDGDYHNNIVDCWLYGRVISSYINSVRGGSIYREKEDMRTIKNSPFNASFPDCSPLSKSKKEGSIGSAVGSSCGSWYG